MAEGVLKECLRKHGIMGVSVSSAGTNGLDGKRAQKYAIKVCEYNGIDISGHVARTLDRAMLEESDLIVVMENEHRERVLELSPEAGQKTSILTEFGEESGKRGFVADPYGLPEWAYESCFAKIESNVSALAESLKSRK
jgi:protein-tyrosine phosphatase